MVEQRPKRIHRAPVRLYMESAELIVFPFSPDEPPTMYRVVIEHHGVTRALTDAFPSPAAALDAWVTVMAEAVPRAEARQIYATLGRVLDDLEVLRRRSNFLLGEVAARLNTIAARMKRPKVTGLDDEYPPRLNMPPGREADTLLRSLRRADLYDQSTTKEQ